MKKISKIIVYILLTLVIVFLLRPAAVAGYSSWTQTSQGDFEAGTLTNINTTEIPGSFVLETTSWEETTTAHFNAGVIKGNIDTSNNELKLLSKAAEEFNQSQTISNTLIPTCSYATAQSFKFSKSGFSTRIQLYIQKYGNPQYNLTVYLKSDNNNSPGTTLTSKTVAKENIPNSYTWITFDWSDVQVTANVRYWIYIPQIGTPTADYHWAIQNSNVYGNGNLWSGAFGHLDQDATFKIYINYWNEGTFNSKQKSVPDNSVWGKFYENHLSGNVSYTFKVRRYHGSAWSSWLTVTNGSVIALSPGNKIQYYAYLKSTDGATNPKVYDVKINYIEGGTGNLISQSHDCGTQITDWANFVANHTLNEQTIEYAVRTSSFAARLSDATWYPVVSGGLITAPVNRYVQWKATLTTTDGTKTPVVDDVTVYWDPYPDTPILIDPEDNLWIKDNTPLFKWKFNDPYPPATQEGFHLIIDDSPDFPGLYYDSGLQESTLSQWQFPDGTGYTTIPDGTWYWKCCTKNNYGLWGATSTCSRFQIDTTPPPIPVMFPEPKLTSGSTNYVHWDGVSDGAGIGRVKYYVQCSSDSLFVSEVDNSGWIDDTFCVFGMIEPLRDGVTYYYRVKAKDGLGNASEYSAWVWSRQDNPIITDYYASPDPFSPNGDGLKDATTIYYTLSRDCTVKVKIYESDETVKRTLIDGLSKSQGPNWVIWDGKDDDGNIVPNGTYIYEITAEDQNGDKGEKKGTVRVENIVTIVSTIPKDKRYLVIWPDKDEEIRMVFNRHMSTTTMIPQNISIIDEDNRPLILNRDDIVCVSSVTTITPSKLEYCTTYTVGVSTDVTDYLGIPLTEEESFSFTTLIPGGLEGSVTVKHKVGKVTINDPSTTFPGGSKGYYINLAEKDIRPLSNYIKGTGRILRCYSVDGSDNPKDIDWLERPVTISIPYPRDTKDKRNLRLYFYNKEINRWELVKGSGDTHPDDINYHVIGEVRITNTEYCVRGFAAGALIEQYSNYPNPFKAGKEDTTIIYDLEEDTKVTISIYDLLGQLVRRIEIAKGTPERGERGTNKVPWNGKNERGRVVANGGYYCVVEADTGTGKHMKKVRKIMVIK